MKPKAQLFCFTYAGGTSTFFDDVEKDLPEYEVVKVEYAGHGTRYKDPFYQSFDELADDVVEIIRKKMIGIPYVLFGYSMGAITVMETLKRILHSDLRIPYHVFLAAHEPEPRLMIRDVTDRELEEWVRKRVIQFGAIPKGLLDNKPFWRTYLPVYMADYRIIGKHRFEDLDLKIDIPTTIFYSETDTPLNVMQKWSRFFTAQCDFQRFSGSHFLMREHHADIGARIDTYLETGVEEVNHA